MTETATVLYKFLKGYYFEHKRIPKMDVICEKLELKNYRVIQYLRELEEIGLLKRNVSHYSIRPENVNFSRPVPQEEKKEEAVKEEKKEVLKEIVIKEDKLQNQVDILPNWILNTMKIIIGIVGLFSIGMSIYFIYLWFQTYFNTLVAIVMGVIWVIFSVICFEIMVLFNKLKIKLWKALCIVWIIMSLFTMSSVVVGQFTLRKDKAFEMEVNDLSLNKEELYKDYSSKIISINKDIDSKRIEKEKLLQFLDKIEDSGKEYEAIDKKIKAKDNEIKKLKEELPEYEKKKEELLKEDRNIQVKKENPFEWLSKIMFGISPGLLQFWLTLFPALFFDIVSPVSFALVLYLKGGKENGT